MEEYETIIKWIYTQRDLGKSEDQIRGSLIDSAWKAEKIDIVMSVPRPKEKKQHNIIKLMYWTIGLFALLIGLMMLVGYGVIGDDTVKFTHEACLTDEDIPEGACDVLNSMLGGEDEADWNNGPVTLATNDIAEGFNDLIIDMNTWTVSILPNIDSATVCAIDGSSLWLLVMSDNSIRWGIDSIIALDKNGTNPRFGNTSYCNSHL